MFRSNYAPFIFFYVEPSNLHNDVSLDPFTNCTVCAGFSIPDLHRAFKSTHQHHNFMWWSGTHERASNRAQVKCHWHRYEFLLLYTTKFFSSKERTILKEKKPNYNTENIEKKKKRSFWSWSSSLRFGWTNRRNASKRRRRNTCVLNSTLLYHTATSSSQTKDMMEETKTNQKIQNIQSSFIYYILFISGNISRKSHEFRSIISAYFF